MKGESEMSIKFHVELYLFNNRLGNNVKLDVFLGIWIASKSIVEEVL